jgi:hypothetical protein
MRFMILVKASKESEAGQFPSAELIAAMGRFNEEMAAAGVMLAGEGLHPSSSGVRVKFSGRERTVTEGPFAHTSELLAGFWLIQVPSREEALAWVSRIPFTDGEEVELRRVFEAEDFPAESMPPAEVAREQALRDELARRAKTPQ